PIGWYSNLGGDIPSTEAEIVAITAVRGRKRAATAQAKAGEGGYWLLAVWNNDLFTNLEACNFRVIEGDDLARITTILSRQRLRCIASFDGVDNAVDWRDGQLHAGIKRGARDIV